MLVKVEQ